MEDKLVGPWEEYADEHVLLIRTLDQYLNNRFEFVYADSDPHRNTLDTVSCFHGIIDMRDYLDYSGGLKCLDAIARGQGYKNFDDLVLYGLDPKDYDKAHGIVLNDDGSINKLESSGYVVDMAYTASIIAEHLWACMDADAPICMSQDEAILWVKNITGKEYQSL